MLRKPNIIQRMFIRNYFRTHKSMIELALINDQYLVVALYTHKFYYSVPLDDVEDEIKGFAPTRIKLCVVNNIIFVW